MNTDWINCPDCIEDHEGVTLCSKHRKPAKLTEQDIRNALDDPRHNGWGLATGFEIDDKLDGRLFRAVARQATKLGLDREELFHWTNSKLGRWVVDEVEGCGVSPTKAVAAYMTAEQVAEVQYS